MALLALLAYRLLENLGAKIRIASVGSCFGGRYLKLEI